MVDTSFADLIKKSGALEVPPSYRKGLMPGAPPVTIPPQSGASPETTVSTSEAETSGTSGDIPSYSSITSGVSGLPSYNTPQGVASTLKDILGFDPSQINMTDALKDAQAQFGDYGVAPPDRKAYKIKEPSESPWMIAGLGLGSLLGGGGYLGETMKGYQDSLQRDRQHQLDMLKAQQEYDVALKNWQAGKAGWTRDIVMAARDAVNAKRSALTAVAPYVLTRQSDILRAQTEVYRAGLQYLSHQDQIQLGYLKEADLNAYRQSELKIHQANAEEKVHYNEAMMAWRNNNLEQVKVRNQALIRAEQVKTEVERANLDLIRAKLPLLQAAGAQKMLDGISLRIEQTTTLLDTLQQEYSKQPFLDKIDPNTGQSTGERVENPVGVLMRGAQEQLSFLYQQQQALVEKAKTVQKPQEGAPQFSSNGFSPGKGWQDPQTGHIWAPDGKGGWVLVR